MKVKEIERVLEVVDSIRFSTRREVYEFLDNIQHKMESENKAVSLAYLCRYLGLILLNGISKEDLKKYVWTNEDFNDALVFRGAADSFKTYKIFLPECREMEIDEDKVLY